MHNFILITGGAGFIGSHISVALQESGYSPVILDNLTNSHKMIVNQLEQITGVRPHFIQGDIRDSQVLKKIFSTYSIQAVMHLSGLKAVGDSVRAPLEYYETNINGTFTLLQTMRQFDVKTLVFSSSATVYGNTPIIPYKEDAPRLPSNPYGRSKMIIEDILADLHYAEPDWRIACLRYFNPVGAHESGLIGENPVGVPNNLMPALAQASIGHHQKFKIFGNDYPTVDGTCVRDYIHVMDLAEGHLAALEYLQKTPQYTALNLGSGVGTSVLEMIQAFEAVNGCKIRRSSPRRFTSVLGRFH